MLKWDKREYRYYPLEVDMISERITMSEDVRDMMLEDSKDLLDNVEVTTVADQCVKLKQNRR